MQTNELMALIENLKSSDYGHIEVSHEGTTLVFDKNSCPPAPIMMAPTAPVASAPVTAPLASAEQETAQVTETESVAVSTPVETTDLTNTVTIDSPIVGTFYNSASPEAEAYVKVGSQVKKGDVVCIIEAMKLMNEIEAEVDGEVVEVLVANEGPVEYNQPLFRIKPL